SHTGRIYAGGIDEFGVITTDSTGQLQYVSLVYLLKQSKPIGNVREIASDSQNVYIATSDKTYCFNENEIKIDTIVTDAIGSNLFSLFGKVFNVNQNGISLLEHGKSRPLPGCDDFDNRKSGRLVLLPYGDNKMLICTPKKGFFVYDLQAFLAPTNPGNITASLTALPLPRLLKEEMSAANGISAIRLNSRRYAIAIRSKGIAFIDSRGNLIRRLTVNDGLADNTIYNMFVDRSGNLWAMGNDGISYIESNSPISVFDERSGLEGMNLAAAKHNGRIYAGSFNGTYYLADVSNGDIKANHLYQIKNSSQSCWDLIIHNDMLFAAGRGIYHIDGISCKKVVQSNQLILCFIKSKKFPNHLFCGLNSGLAAIKINKTAPGKPGPIPENSLLKRDEFPELIEESIYLSSAGKNGDLWLTSISRGLIHLQFTGPLTSDYKITRYNTSQGLPKARAILTEDLKHQQIFFDDKNVYVPVYPGTKPGSPIKRFEKKAAFHEMPPDLSLTFNRSHMEEKKTVLLCNESTIGFLAAGHGTDWKWNPAPFLRLRGLFRTPVIDDNTLWICSTEGLIRFDPEHKKEYAGIGSILLRRVIINNKKVLFNGNFCSPATREGDWYKRIVPAQPPESAPTLEYKDNSITFEYSAPFYENATANRFAYKLSGYKDEWSDWAAETRAVYTNLTEGDYCFRVKAKNTFRQESGEAFYRFSVSPPWYRTVYAIAGYVLVLLLLFYGGIKLYYRRHIAARKRLEATVTERTLQLQREREIAEAANHSKSMFLARMSHEIRTPINGVIGFAEMLNDTPLSREQADYTRTIARSGEALLTLVNDILDFSKIEAGELTFDIIDFDLEIMVFDICHIILPRIGEKPVEVLCSIADDVPAFIKSDPGRLRQILLNLMANAAKFTHKGEIELSVSFENNSAEGCLIHAAVRDTGIGIPRDKQAKIFEDFKQADGTISRKYGGTGLGLAICNQLTELMDGRIWLDSTPGKGSTFHLTVKVEKSQKQPVITAGNQSLAGKTVLVADDNASNLGILAHTLKKLEMSCIPISDSRLVVPAIEELAKKNTPPDVCLLDIAMPYKSGYDMAKQIRAHHDSSISQLPLLACSSSIVKQSIIARKCGFSAYLTKPISKYKLEQMLKRLLEMDGSEVKGIGKQGDLLTGFTLAEESKHSTRILLVEDNSINRKLAAMMLTKAGYQLETAQNGREAVEKVTAHPDKFALILMDINMPEMDGRQATQILREKGLDIPIVAVTAEAMKEDRTKCIKAGMNDYISKPIKREIVFRMVEKWTRKSSSD
ncbi:MAG: response regulator, partial [bacterium]|nr:response regulator [bacterium]